MTKTNQISKINENFSVFHLITFIILCIFTLGFIILFFWALITSFKTADDFVQNYSGLPMAWVFDNYKTVFVKFGPMFVGVDGYQHKATVVQMVTNSLLFSFGCAFFATIIPCFMSYIVVRFPCKLSSIFYGIVIVTMTLPVVGTYPAEIDMLKNTLNIYNKWFTPMFLKANFLGMYFLIFYGAIKTLGKEYWEAAYIDGAGQFNVLFRIILPLIRNTIFLVMLLLFIQFWNDYQMPYLYVPSFPTIAFGIFDLSQSTDGDMGFATMKMTACIIFMMPILVLFIIFKDKIMGNITMGGIKE